MSHKTGVAEEMKARDPLTHIPAELLNGGMVTTCSFPPTDGLQYISADLFENSLSFHHHFGECPDSAEVPKSD